MQGAIARRAEEVYESLSEQAKAALASVFSLLVSTPEREAASGKPAPLEEFKRRPGAEEVVNSFVKASLLLSDVDVHGTSVVSLAHEALLSSWPRLQEWLQQNYEFLKVRERVATATQRWSDEDGADAYLLAEGKPLVEAKELLNRHPETLSGKEMQFIRASIQSEQTRRRREAVRRRKVLMTISVALVVAIIFGVISFWQYQKATSAAKAANQARDQADGLITFMLHNLRDKLRPIGRLDALDDVAKKAKEYLDNLPKDLITASRLKQKIAMLDNLGDVRVAQGKLQDALDGYQQSLTIAKRLAEQDKSNARWQRDLPVIYNMVGKVLEAQGKLQDALDVYQQSLKIRQTLAEQDKTNSGWQTDLSVSYEKVGDLLMTQGDLAGALKNYRDKLAIAEKLASQTPANAHWQNSAAWSRYCVAKVLIQIKDGDRNEANRLVIEGIDIMTRLEHAGALDKPAQDTLNKLKELATALTSSSMK